MASLFNFNCKLLPFCLYFLTRASPFVSQMWFVPTYSSSSVSYCLCLYVEAFIVIFHYSCSLLCLWWMLCDLSVGVSRCCASFVSAFCCMCSGLTVLLVEMRMHWDVSGRGQREKLNNKTWAFTSTSLHRRKKTKNIDSAFITFWGVGRFFPNRCFRSSKQDPHDTLLTFPPKPCLVHSQHSFCSPEKRANLFGNSCFVFSSKMRQASLRWIVCPSRCITRRRHEIIPTSFPKALTVVVLVRGMRSEPWFCSQIGGGRLRKFRAASSSRTAANWMLSRRVFRLILTFLRAPPPWDFNKRSDIAKGENSVEVGHVVY